MSGKCTPPDGDPVDMSKVTLGPRYGSEDMYRDLGLNRGDLASVEIGGVVYTDYIENLIAKPPVYPQLTGWQRVARGLTPKRWRKTLKPIRTDPLARAQALTAKTLALVERLTAEPVKVPWWRRWMKSLQR